MSILFGKKTHTMVRGAAWSDDVLLTSADTGAPVNLAGITGVLMRLREFVDSPVLLELSVANDRLVVVDAASGHLGIRVPTADTLLLPANGHYKAVYLYDALIERSPGEYEPAIGGKVVVLPTITRPSET